MLKLLEDIIFKFLWDNKPDKVSRDLAKLSEKAGGLGVPDIKSFWLALKFSWLRRLINTGAFWPKIVCEEVKNIVGGEVTVSEILQYGPNYLSYIGKKVKNIFWRHVMSSVSPIMQGALFCHPENIVIAPLWDNPLIKRNNKPLKKSAHLNFSNKLTSISNFCNPGSSVFLTRRDLESKYNINITEETLIELHYIFNSAHRNLGIQDGNLAPTFNPFQPLLISIANQVKKGCSVYYRYIRKKENLNTSWG